MNRTAQHFVFRTAVLAAAFAVAVAQDPAPKAGRQSQDPTIDQVVAELRAQEAAARTVELDLVTEGHLQGGLEFSTRGTIRVLRAAQGDLTAVQSTVDYSFSDGLTGRVETVKVPDGVWMYEQNPTRGEVFVHMDKQLVADLEWAGRILQRSDLPGMVDARQTAPLGSELLADLAQRYTLAPMSHKDKSGQIGIWYGGDRREAPGLDAEDPDVPLADHVELFVRDGDHALLEVVYLQAGKVMQRIKVDRLVVGGPMPLEGFKLDDRGRRPRDAKEDEQLKQQIEETMRRAEARVAELEAAGKLPAGEGLPPSRRAGK